MRERTSISFRGWSTMARHRITTAVSLAAISSRSGTLAAERGTAGEEAYERLREAIVRCHLRPAAVLSEADLAAQLGVSRTPIREALRRLAGEGLLEVSPQVGTFISKLRRRTIADALFLRESIECAAARLAVRAPLKERKHLLIFVSRQRAAIRAGDVEENLRQDEALHKRLIELSGHPGAWEVVRQARAHLERLRRIAIPELHGNRTAVEQHEQIATAIVNGNAAAAAEYLRTHIRLIEGFIDGIAAHHPDYFDDPK